MKRPIIVRPEAEADIAAAFDWYEGQRFGLGFEFIREFEHCLGRIEDYPEGYPVIYRSYRRALTKKFPYKVFYVVESDYISVVAIVHAARHPQHWRTRLQPRQE